MLNASWQFGFFPNTRTYAGITPYTGLTYSIEKDANKTFGINTGFLINGYYYISRGLRLHLRARFSYVKDFDQTVPTPFWNTVNYSNSSMNSMRITNDNVPFPVDASSFLNNAIGYEFSFSLNYAIF